MIYDELDSIACYRALLGPNGDAILSFLGRGDLELLPNGEHPIVGRDAYAIVQTYLTRAREQCVWESHRRYVDVQLVLHGREFMGRQNIGAMAISQPYDESRDRILYTDPNPDPTRGVTVGAGQFTIFLPHDAHQPGVAAGEVEEVKKVVIKLRSGHIGGAVNG